MFNIFKKQKGTGALIDDRPIAEKQKDYLFEELVANVNPVQWKEKKSNEWKKYPIYDQNGSGSCVAHTLAKMLGVMYQEKEGNYVHFSATHVYQRRSNRPGGGMIGVDALDIGRKGVTLEELVPSQKMTDAQMDSIMIPEYKKKVGEIFKAGNYIQIPIMNIDTVASIIQTTGKPVMVWYYFNHDEWTNSPVVKRNVNVYDASTSRHSVTAVDFCLINGKKHLIIDDSWGPGHGTGGQRAISEDFHKVRNFFAAYYQNFQFAEGDETNKPKYNFTKTMRYEPNKPITYNDPEVVALQDCLRYEGTFPINSKSTGYFGTVTQKAVRDFQTKYGLGVDGIVGPVTRSKLNELFK